MKKIFLTFAIVIFSLPTIAQILVSNPNNFDAMPTNNGLLKNGSNNESLNIPYPIIFIHGLNSNAGVWTELSTQLINSGLSFGGRIDVCLNDDGNNEVSNKLIYPTPNADIRLYTDFANDLSIADVYWLNFDIDNLGRLRSDSNFVDVLSNESAIVKQGVAVSLAIQVVLQKTGRDKVILMGHSMGGLASREYIQNPAIWQADGLPHVAKLISTGTPHGGYTGINAMALTGIDDKSEAYRDLRKSYLASGEDGVYLYGGLENYSTIDNNFLYDFYNVDVNCNSVDSDNSIITGLNEKSLPLTLDYAYIIGDCTNCNLLQGNIEGDGIVRSENANLSNYYELPLPINEFIYQADASSIVIGLHSDLPAVIPVSMQGLDEANEYILAYEVELNQEYKGFITQQPVNGYLFDFDDYKISINNNSSYNITVSNTFDSDLTLAIYDFNETLVSTNTVSGNTTELFMEQLEVGMYYLEFIAEPSVDSYLYPYTYFIEDATLSIENEMLENNIRLYPNPTTSAVYFDNSIAHFETLEITNLLGQSIQSKTLDSSIESVIDLSSFENGVYLFRFKKQGVFNTFKVVKN